MNLTNEEIAYIAGLFDGKGTFTITERKRQKYPSYAFTEVYITNTDKKVMDWLSSKMEGKIRISRYSKNGWKDVYKFHILLKNRKEFISLLLPYLIIKKNQANIAFQLLSLMEKQKANRRGVNGLTKKEWKQRHELAEKIKEFNKRGVKNKNFSALRD